jgi:3-oxoadipate enol-lactonase
MPLTALNGITCYYESTGDGETVTFLHGAGGNHVSWWQQVPHFRHKYRCLTLDHRGFSAMERTSWLPQTEAALAQVET